jgi:DNA-directed RNA polymerase specialized sigma24 family protein
LSLTSESLEALLAWLDSDRERAGLKYEAIRGGLIRVFKAKGFADAEDLADQTINRVADRLPDITAGYVGEPVNYFRGVARNIILEAWRRKEVGLGELPLVSTVTREMSDEYECLLKCLKFLSTEERELALDYHLYRGRDKVRHHQCMADDQGMTPGALRVRVHRIRVTLEKCVTKCTRAVRAETKPAPSRIIRQTTER